MDIVGQLQEGMRALALRSRESPPLFYKILSFTASASIDELAASAGVSPATITRFARSVGCEDIRDLRKQLAQASERRASWLTPDSAALPAAWRDKLSIWRYPNSAAGHTRKRRWKSCKSRLLSARAVHCFRPRRPGRAGRAAPASAAALRHRD
jgi:AcrR family transcriptional regulator